MNLRRWALWGLGALATVWGLAYADLVLRARSAFLEGEKYMLWARQPDLKKAWFDARLDEDKVRIEGEVASGRLTALEGKERVEVARFARDEAVAESSLKYAYHWYQTTVELFSPPESRWVRRARERMAEAKRLWKAELDSKKIPYQDYMLE